MAAKKRKPSKRSSSRRRHSPSKTSSAPKRAERAKVRFALQDMSSKLHEALVVDVQAEKEALIREVLDHIDFGLRSCATCTYVKCKT